MSELDANMPEDVWIYDNKQASEYVSYNAWLMSTYWEIVATDQRSKMKS